MIGAIVGDIIGSVHEGMGTKFPGFPLLDADCRFTDDTILTVAVADKFLRNGNYVDLYHDYFHAYPQAGYGQSFILWAGHRKREPYGSWGNGSAMRVSPVAYVFDSLNEVLSEAARSAEVTHNHPEGIRGAQAVAAAVFLARTGASKAEIRREVERLSGYDLSESLSEIWHTYGFDVSCQGSVPQSIIAFLESRGYEDAVRKAVSLGGDADTMACIAGAIAEAFYGGVPDEISTPAMALLDLPLKDVIGRFRQTYFTSESRP
jgi:ADP-ribosylglycohydrolase